MLALELVAVAFLIVLNGFFAMAELAVVSSRRPRLTAMADAGSAGARAALGLLENQSRFLSSVQIGITLIGVLAGAFGGATLAEDLAVYLEGFGLGPGAAETVGVVVVVAAITYFSLIVGELVPKQIALGNPERVASAVAAPMVLVARIASPAVWLLEISSRLLLGLLGRGGEPEQRVTEEEIRLLIAEAESAGVVEPQETRMIARVMRLGDRSVRALMTPRPDIDWVDLDQDVQGILARLRASAHSRLPAGHGGIDRVGGVLHAKDVLHEMMAERGVGGSDAFDPAALVRPAPTVHDTADALDALEALRASPVDMAFVVDEHGTFEGVVTKSDLLEAIAGQFAAQAGEEEPDAVRREDGSWLLAGWKPVDDMADLLQLALPAGRRDYHTVAGFALARLRRFPRLGDAFEAGGWRFEVVDVDGRRIDKILAQPGRGSVRAAA